MCVFDFWLKMYHIAFSIARKRGKEKPCNYERVPHHFVFGFADRDFLISIILPTEKKVVVLLFLVSSALILASLASPQEHYTSALTSPKE